MVDNDDTTKITTTIAQTILTKILTRFNIIMAAPAQEIVIGQLMGTGGGHGDPSLSIDAFATNMYRVEELREGILDYIAH